MLELVGEGEVSPSAEKVAERAGVGLRSVFRHFENMEGLYQEINALVAIEIEPIISRPFVASDWRGQLAEGMDRRAELFERVTPFKIAGEVNRHYSRFLDEKAREMTRALRAGLGRLLPPGVLADSSAFESLDMLLSFETWRRLRRDQGLAPAEARALLGFMVDRLIGALDRAGAGEAKTVSTQP